MTWEIRIPSEVTSAADGTSVGEGAGDGFSLEDWQNASSADQQQMINSAVSNAEASIDPSTLMAECGSCIRFEQMQQQYLNGDINQTELMNYYEAKGNGAIIGLSILNGAFGIRALWMTQIRNDLIRFAPTVVSNQIVRGPGATGATAVRWAIKGGGRGMPFHYHIHRYNWYKPWTWFRQTPIIKP